MGVQCTSTALFTIHDSTIPTPNSLPLYHPPPNNVTMQPVGRRAAVRHLIIFFSVFCLRVEHEMKAFAYGMWFQTANIRPEDGPIIRVIIEHPYF